jgi:Ser/Thr protein kinase RdoA (MazF antagonist)
MNYTDLKISNKDAEKILLQLYGIKATTSKLPGESDFNFKVTIGITNCYILKISRPKENKSHIIFQQKLLQFLMLDESIISPKVILDQKDSIISEYKDVLGNTRIVRLLSWVSGRLWNDVNPQSNNLRFDLGQECGKLTNALQSFKYTKIHRDFEWDIAQSLWTTNYLKLFNSKEKEIITFFQSLFEDQLKNYKELRKTLIHNDINDNNIVVSKNTENPKVIGFIDYADAIYTQTINDLATACAYAIMHHNDPLEASLAVVKGYNDTYPLKE